MKLDIVKQDLFTVPADYYLCHCVSSDFALGAGIARKFAERGVRDALIKRAAIMKGETWFGIGYCIPTALPEPHGAFNLVTKERYWHKPTLISMKQALLDMRERIPYPDDKIAMPKIGCGLDRLNWVDVERLIRSIFADTDVEILVCEWR